MLSPLGPDDAQQLAELRDFLQKGVAIIRRPTAPAGAATTEDIQQLVDTGKFGFDDRFALDALGAGIGDIIIRDWDEFEWAVCNDEYGRDLVLRVRGLTTQLNVFSLIPKRLESGEEWYVRDLTVDLPQGILEWSRRADKA